MGPLYIYPCVCVYKCIRISIRMYACVYEISGVLKKEVNMSSSSL